MALNAGYTYRVTLDASDEGRPLAEVLAARYPHSSSATWRLRLAGGEIAVDGAAVDDAAVARRGQRLEWRRPPWDEPDVPLAFDVLHEDADVVAVAKPAGLPTMPAGGFLAHTLLALARARFGWVAPLHRLGRHTSGVVVFARHGDAAAALGAAWRAHRVTKVYRALVGGAPPWDTCRVETPIGPVPHATLGTVFAASPTGRPSRSEVTV
ncbi:MAG: pseudouridine synthase, partial [Candidatus Binatia bacterium]